MPRLKARLETKNYLSGGKFIQKKELYLYKNPNPKELLDIFKIFSTETDGFISGMNTIQDGFCELVCVSYSDEDVDFKIIPWVDA